MFAVDFDASVYSSAAKTEEELEELVSALSKYLAAADDEVKSQACVQVGGVLKDWQMDIGVRNRAALHLGVVLVSHLNSIDQDESTTHAFSLAEAMAPHLQEVFGDVHEITLRAVLCRGELLAKVRETEQGYRTLQRGLALMEAEAVEKNVTPVELFGILPGQFYLMIGKVELERGNAEAALERFEKATELQRAAPRSLEQSQKLVDTLITYARFAVETGALSDSEALELFLEARSRAEEILDKEPECYFHVIPEIADHHSKSGNPKEATAELERALALAQDRFPPTHRQVLLAKANVASVLTQYDFVERAQAILEEILPLAEGMKLECSILESLAAIYADIGRQKDAEAYLNRGVTLAIKHFGDTSDAVVDALRAKAALLASLSRLDEAMGVLNQALAINEDIEEGVPYNIFDLRELAAKITLEMGDIGEARAHAQAMLNLRQEAVGRRHPHFADVLFLQARIELREDSSAALELVREAIDIHEEFYEGKAHQATAEMLEAAAELLIDDEGEPEEGIKMQRKAVEMYDQLYGETAPDAITSSLALAAYLQDNGGEEEAFAMVKAVISRLGGTGYHLYMAMAYATLAELEVQNFDVAIETNKKALTELDKMERPHELRVTIHQALADLYNDTMDVPKATLHLEAACEAALVISGENSPEYAGELHTLATFFVDTQQPERAIDLIEKATKIRMDNYVSADDIADGLVLMAMALQACQRLEEAGAKYEEALAVTTDMADAEIESKILYCYGEFLLTVGTGEDALDKGCELLERAHPMYVELMSSVMTRIPTMLFNAFPEQAMRWMPMFEAAMEAMEDFREEFEEKEPEVAGDFNAALAEIRAQLQGSLTKGAM